MGSVRSTGGYGECEIYSEIWRVWDHSEVWGVWDLQWGMESVRSQWGMGSVRSIGGYGECEIYSEVWGVWDLQGGMGSVRSTVRYGECEIYRGVWGVWDLQWGMGSVRYTGGYGECEIYRGDMEMNYLETSSISFNGVHLHIKYYITSPIKTICNISYLIINPLFFMHNILMRTLIYITTRLLFLADPDHKPWPVAWMAYRWYPFARRVIV